MSDVDKKKTPKRIDIKIERRNDSRLWTVHNGKDVAIRVETCFPWSHPKKYISLRDDERNEIALIEDLDEMDSESADLVREALRETAFVMQIETVLSIQEEFEVRTWDVETKQGRRKFQTKRDAWPQTLPDGGLLIRDIAGDLFFIASPHNMDPASRKFLAPFID